jgi:hypothetical protein
MSEQSEITREQVHTRTIDYDVTAEPNGHVRVDAKLCDLRRIRFMSSVGGRVMRPGVVHDVELLLTVAPERTIAASAFRYGETGVTLAGRLQDAAALDVPVQAPAPVGDVTREVDLELSFEVSDFVYHSVRADIRSAQGGSRERIGATEAACRARGDRVRTGRFRGRQARSERFRLRIGAPRTAQHDDPGDHAGGARPAAPCGKTGAGSGRSHGPDQLVPHVGRGRGPLVQRVRAALEADAGGAGGEG